jgi:hypothetical protein
MIISLAVSTPARGQQATENRAAQLDAAFAAVERATTTQDLIREATTASYNTAFVREGLWYASALGTLPKGYGDELKLKRVIKALVFATLLELAARGELSRWPKDEQLFAIGPNSLAAIPKYVAFAREGDPLLGTGDPINSWLKRGPSIDECMVDGNYHYRRINTYVTGTYELLEWTDTSVLGLSPQAKTLQGALGAEYKEKTTLGEALSYSLPLANTRFIVAIAKAYLCLSLLPPNSPLSKYALTIAGSSFFFLSQATGSDERYNLAATASDILRESVAAFRAGGRLLTAENLQPRLTAARFFARKFAVALEDYEAAASAPNRPADFHAYGEWGAAMCQFGMGQTSMAAEHLLRLATLLQKETPALDHSPYRYIMAAIVDAAGAKSLFGERLLTESLKAAIASWRNLEFSEGRHELNMDLFSTLNTIGRYDIEARFTTRELAHVHQLAHPDFRAIEAVYLQELGAALSDAFSDLSWTLDEDGSFKPRLKDMKEWSHQFAPAPMDKYLAGCLGTNRYGACSPEEDRATVWELYAPASFAPFESMPSQVLQQVIDNAADHKSPATDSKSNALPPSAPVPAKDFTQWVLQEYSRKPPNVVPLLKLAWMEWFFLPMPRSSTGSWHYRPVDKSGITSVVGIEARLKEAGPSVSPQTKRVWELFREVHDFLLRNYQ